jgi:SPP1 family phage portal protein
MGILGNIAEMIKKESYTMSETEFFEAEIAAWKGSAKRKRMIDGERYFRGDHDILKRERTAIGSDGKLKKVGNLPNNRIVDNQYQRLVNQKVNYLLGKRFVFDTDCDDYRKELENIFGDGFRRMMKCIMRDCVNCGIAWLYPYIGEDNSLMWRRIPGYEVLPFWKDGEREELDAAVRIYEIEGYMGKEAHVYEMAEIYTMEGVQRCEAVNGHLIKTGEFEPYPWGMGGIPLIAFKYNEKEIPLISRVKSLQDALNETVSDYENGLQEDARNTILVLQNYDGTDLGEFRQNLATYGAVKVRTIDGAPGDIKTLSSPFDAEKYEKMITLLKNSITENAMGYDSKSDKLGNSPNQMAIRSMYSDLDLDMSEAETEMREGFSRLRKYADEYLLASGRGYFKDEKLNIVFNRDCLVNETEAIENCVKSEGILSEETIVLQHPWVDDVGEEMAKKRK